MKTLADLTVPAEIQRGPLLEAEVQKQCVDWMRGRGYWARKFSSMSQRSVPDYLFGRFSAPRETVSLKRIKFFTEFKREGCPAKLLEKYGVTVMSTEAQYEEQVKMIEAGWIGFECDNFEQFKAEVERIEAACCTGEV